MIGDHRSPPSPRQLINNETHNIYRKRWQFLCSSILSIVIIDRNNQLNFLCRWNRPNNIPNMLLSVTECVTIQFITILERNAGIDFWGHCLLWAVNHSPYYPDSSRLIGNKTGQRDSTGWQKMMYFIVQFYDQIDRKIRRIVCLTDAAVLHF